MTKALPAQDQIHHLLSLSDASKILGISNRLFREAVGRRQLGEVKLMQLGARQFVRATDLISHLESVHAPKKAAA